MSINRQPDSKPTVRENGIFRGALKEFDSEEETKRNWFQMWLVQMGEGIQRELGEEATDTPTGAFRKRLGI